MRHACIQALVAMLVDDRLSEEEFGLRWKLALEATTSAELDLLLYDADGDDEGAAAVENGENDLSGPASHLRRRG